MCIRDSLVIDDLDLSGITAFHTVIALGIQLCVHNIVINILHHCKYSVKTVSYTHLNHPDRCKAALPHRQTPSSDGYNALNPVHSASGYTIRSGNHCLPDAQMCIRDSSKMAVLLLTNRCL